MPFHECCFNLFPYSIIYVSYVRRSVYPKYVEFSDYNCEHENCSNMNFIAVKNEKPDIISVLSQK